MIRHLPFTPAVNFRHPEHFLGTAHTMFSDLTFLLQPIYRLSEASPADILRHGALNADDHFILHPLTISYA